jgi:formylglycine-generating enzyme required for sulfatase activity
VGGVERAVKWVKRNRIVTAAAVAVGLVLTVGTTVSYLKYLDAEQQRGFAEDRRKEAETQKTIAEDRWREAEKLKTLAEAKEQEVRKQADKASRAWDFLASMFRLSEEEAASEVSARRILESAEQRIPNVFADQPEFREALLADIRRVRLASAASIPFAMLLEVQGMVALQSASGLKKEAVPQTLLNAGDQLRVPADAQVLLLFLTDLHKERLKPGQVVTIRRKGCEPADAVLKRDDSVLMTFAPLPKGTFYMGWNGHKGSAKKTEIKEDFEIAVHDVTQGQWETIMGKDNNPSHFSRKGGGRSAVLEISDEALKLFPVESVSWNDAQEFIKKLNEKERDRGYLYRLPTEAEWEYACRGGASSEEECSFHFYFDKPTNDLSSEQANFNGTMPFGKAPQGPNKQRTTRVGEYPPNKLGLCDMHGNVYQWCEDLFVPKGSDRVFRGGTWGSSGASCRAAERSRVAPAYGSVSIGFRLARVPIR